MGTACVSVGGAGGGVCGNDSSASAVILISKVSAAGFHSLGDSETGCTIHFVTEEVDGGPILIQKTCPVEEDDTVDSLKTRVQSLEGQAFIEAINLITSN